MLAKIKFNELYKEEFLFETDKELVDFFTMMKNEFCNDILNRNIPLLTLSGSVPSIERIEVIPVSDYQETAQGYRYSGTFKVVGIRSLIVYDVITVELEDVRFLKLVDSIDDYLASTFKLRYSGSLIKLEDIKLHSQLTKKDMENRRVVSLSKLTDETELLQLTLELEKVINRKNFEVSYTAMGTTQSYFCYYDNENERKYLKDLFLQTKTYEVKVRIIDNDLYETYRLANGEYKPKIRKAI